MEKETNKIGAIVQQTHLLIILAQAITGLKPVSLQLIIKWMEYK
jgi:hypothetical protein